MVWDHNAQTIVLLSALDDAVRVCIRIYLIIKALTYVFLFLYRPHRNSGPKNQYQL